MAGLQMRFFIVSINIPGHHRVIVIDSLFISTNHSYMENKRTGAYINKVTQEMALDYHEEGRPGKIEVVPTKPYASQRDLSLAYSPGVAYPCLEIEKNPADAYRYTNKGNLVGVVSNGTAVLGLGDIGALAGKPVMEGKALLFKIFAGLDAFDIEINEKDPDRLVEIVKALTPTFGGINLEDIKSPECFRIEQRLKEECDIPIMHDDQHGTAIISSAGLLNALDLQGKKIGDIRLVVNGAGAAAISCTSLYVSLGVRPENVVMCDSKGVIRKDRPNLSEQKASFATSRDIHTLAEAMVDADVFLGLSVAGILTPDMVRSMAPKPIVFALANPDPEISYYDAKDARPDVIVATGRSDYPNQINNVIGFPYIFRGALDCGATTINEAMKIGAVYAIAQLAREPVPGVVDKAYGLNDMKFGPDYILPKALDPRLLLRVAPAVAKAAEESGVAKRPITDWEAYRMRLEQIMGDDGKLMRRLTDMVKKSPRKVVFTEGDNDNVVRAAAQLAAEKTGVPLLLGNPADIAARALRLGLSLDEVTAIDTHSHAQSSRRDRFARALLAIRERCGLTLDAARELMFDRVYFGMMMVQTGEADAMVGGIRSAGSTLVHEVASIVGIRGGMSHFATMHVAHTRRGTFFLADTAINAVADREALVDIIRQVDRRVRDFGIEPVMAVLSYSNFGSNCGDPEPREAAAAVAYIHEHYPEIAIDGEMQLDYALDTALRDRTFPFNTIRGKEVNTLIFPSLGAANTTYKMMLAMGAATMSGPIECGLSKPVYFCSVNASESELTDLAVLAQIER